ncbi:Crp/Fnr family transcriptional regulator [Trichloromonas sp.]|uniref:Crp/Fnr family transcriptional regulator n=1 Tax=Trichloromonas sp. TaxID=3069249 RepID=UPI003D814C84
MHAQSIRETFRFLNKLTVSELDLFLSFCEHRQVSQGTTLWHEGDADYYAAFILRGKLVLKKKTEFGSRQLIVGIHAQGSLVGENNLLAPDPRPVSAEAIETTDLIILQQTRFEALLVQAPQIGMQLLKQISISTSMRLTQSYDRLAAIF